MIEGVRTIGDVALQRNPSIVEALVQEEEVPQGQKKHVVFLNLRLDPPELSVDLKPLDHQVLAEVLWVGNAASNRDQDRLTTGNVKYNTNANAEYLVSQTVPNLLGALGEGELRQKLEKLHQAIYLDLGKKSDVFPKGGDAQYLRYSQMWDLAKLGLAKLELIENKKDREELGSLCEDRGLEFLARSFLQEYARIKGKAKAAVQLVSKVVETWVLKQLDLKRSEVALYTIKLDGELLASHPDYAAYLEKTLVNEAFKEDLEGVCHTCGREGEITADMTRFKLLKFYITDKPGFASGFHGEGFLCNYALCRKCYRSLLVGERFVENNLRTRLAHNTVYVIPVFHLPSVQPTAATLERWAKYLQKRLAATQTLKQWQKFEKELKDYQEFENAKASFVLNMLFASKAQGAVKVDNLIQDVPPSRLDRLDEVRNQVRDAAKAFLGDSNEWDLSLGRIFYLFPIHVQQKQAQTRPFLEFLNTLLTERSVRTNLLIPQLLETASVHYFERYSAYVQDRSSQNQQSVDRALIIFLLQSQLLLLYLKELGQLESSTQGGKTMGIEREALDDTLMAYLQELGLDRGQKALFLLGYLIGQIGSTREQRESGKPILNKVYFQGMDQGKVIRLANDVYEKLRQYRIANYNEAVYAAMKTLLDQEHAALSSPQENTYWLLSGYAYATWQAIRHGKTKQEVPQADTEGVNANGGVKI